MHFAFCILHCMLGLYVHIPCCSAICNYCNFNRGLFDASVKGRYVEAMLAEIRHSGLSACVARQSSDPRAAADTVYFGGGTPSLLEPEEIAQIIDTCVRSFDVADDREV